MNRRVWLHIGFWMTYVALYTFLSGRYDMRFGTAFISELAQLPAKIGAAYLIFRWVELAQGQILRLLSRAFVVILIASFVNRMVMYFWLYPTFYKQSYTMQFWDLDRLLYVFIDVGTAVAVAVALRLTRFQIKSREREQQLVQEKLQSELQFLRAQTNPHFLFNTLNNIYAMARRESPQTAALVIRLSKLLRFMLYECSKPAIPLADELKVMHDLIELEKLRYGKRLEIQFEEELDHPNQPIAPLLLLPFVENAFKHGASENRFLTKIQICLQLQNKNLSFYIKNDKEPGESSNGEGLGLQNVRRQLELLYPNAYQLEIANQPDHFSIKLKLNLK